MNRVLLFGGTGHLGSQIARELKEQGYYMAAVVRSEEKIRQIEKLADKCIIADVTKPGMLAGICNDFDIVVSSLGKSVSLFDRGRAGFEEVDLIANAAILDESIKSGVRKFVYVSAFHSERFVHLTYFRVHHLFSEKLINSGIDYSIIKPPALFSAFLDLVPMAQKGRLVHMGKGDKRTNPISEKDLARICVDEIRSSNTIIEAGGKEILTRKEINETIQRIIAPGKTIRTIPFGLVKMMLPVVKIFSRNMFDKMSFYTAVLQNDELAPQMGQTRLEEYLHEYQMLDTTMSK